jgi:hypothetical protein
MVQLGVVALNSAPALNVEVEIDPRPVVLISLQRPIRLPMVNLENPCYFDIAIIDLLLKHLPSETVITFRYRDIAGNSYEYKSEGDAREGVCLVIGSDVGERIARAVEKLAN